MKIRLAEHADDPGLRKLMRSTVMPGHIRLVYTREPDFFAFHRITGRLSQIIVADANNRIVGIGCRSIRPYYVDGKSRPVGYLSGLRILDSFQNGTLLARGFSFLRKLHGDGMTDVYLTTIIQGNEPAKRLLTSNRVKLPRYFPMGTYLTHILPVRKTADISPLSETVQIKTALQVPSGKLLEFLNETGRQRNFFPVYDRQDLETGIFKNIGMENILMAMKGSEIQGVLGIWNQDDFKQKEVAGYSLPFRILRPVINTWLKVNGYRTLPAAGRHLRLAVAAAICIKDDHPGIFRALLEYAVNRSAQNNFHHLAVGMHERDPLRQSINSYYHITYRSSLYMVGWEDRVSYCNNLKKDGIPYLELGTI